MALAPQTSPGQLPPGQQRMMLSLLAQASSLSDGGGSAALPMVKAPLPKPPKARPAGGSKGSSKAAIAKASKPGFGQRKGSKGGSQSSAKTGGNKNGKRKAEPEQAAVGPSIPVTKIKAIMKKNEQVQNLSGEAVELMAHATEHFIRHFSTLASRHNTGKSNTLEYDALAEATQSEESLNFLRMMVPRRVQYSEVLASRDTAAAEATAQEEDDDASDDEESSALAIGIDRGGGTVKVECG